MGHQVFTDTAYGFGYGDDGNIYFGGSLIEYNDGFKAGDIIGVYLNMDMETLKFSVNGADHGAAFDSIALHEDDGVTGYRLAVSLQHRPHRLTLLESRLFNVERRSPRPTANGAVAPSFGGPPNHQRRLSYNLNNKKVPRSPASAASTPLSHGHRTPTHSLSAEPHAADLVLDGGPKSKKKKSKAPKSSKGAASKSLKSAKSGSKPKAMSKAKTVSNLKVKDKKKGHRQSASGGAVGGKKSKKKKGKKSEVDGAKKSKKKKDKKSGDKLEVDGLKKKKRKKKRENVSTSSALSGVSAVSAGSVSGDDSKEQEAATSNPKRSKKGKKGSSAKWVRREEGAVKERWECCGPKLVTEGKTVSTKSNIKDGNSSLGHIVVGGGKRMKARWELAVKHGDNIGLGVCSVVGGLKTAKNKKLLTQSFTNDINGYGYMGNDGGVQRSGRYKKYGQQFKAGDKVAVVLDTKQKTLSFELNGEDQGVAFKNLPSGDYRLAAAFFERSQKIVLQHTAIWDLAK